IHYYETSVFQNKIAEVMRIVFETTIGTPLKKYSLLPYGRNSVEKALTKKSASTIAKMIKLKKNPSTIVLPTEFIEHLKPEEPEKRWAVMIFEPTTQIIRTIPTKSPTVSKFYIELTEEDLMPKFLEELGEVLERYDIHTLYSYWMCNCPEHPYIVYIDSIDSPISEDQFKSKLLALPIVTKVKVTKYSL
ncbi:MAG: hypothetical protein ACFFDT_13335, partial [Candidatus Hodarchaeota archaeon]